MARVKGTAIVASMRYVTERFGQGALTALLRELPEEYRREFEAGILVSTWYPMALFLRFMQEAEKRHGTAEPDLVRRMGRASAEYGLKTVYKIFFKVGSPEFIIRRSARVFGSYYDTGSLKVLETSRGRALLELEGFEGAPQFCDRILGWMERTVELAGAKNLRPSHQLCIHRGDAVCRFEGIWD